MRKNGWAALFASVVLAVALPAAAADNGEAKAVLAANTGFYSALNIMFTGDAAPMEGVWSHAGDVTYMGPTGDYDRGWAAVRRNWLAQAARKLGGRVEPAEIHLLLGRDIAVLSDYEVGENTNANGKIARVKLRATNIFRKEAGAWKMVGHHTDTLPYLSP